MKCKKCDGTGYYHAYGIFDDIQCSVKHKCELCNGTGEMPVTNEEWFCKMASTEERAMELESVIRRILVQRAPMCHEVTSREFWEKWLKEKHGESE